MCAPSALSDDRMLAGANVLLPHYEDKPSGIAPNDAVAEVLESLRGLHTALRPRDRTNLLVSASFGRYAGMWPIRSRIADQISHPQGWAGMLAGHPAFSRD